MVSLNYHQFLFSRVQLYVDIPPLCKCTFLTSLIDALSTRELLSFADYIFRVFDHICGTSPEHTLRLLNLLPRFYHVLLT